MPRLMRVGASLMLAVTTAAFPLVAQQSADTAAAERGARRAVEVWGGLASNSPRWGLLGASPEMNFGLLAVRFVRPVGPPPRRAGAPTFEFMVDLIPVAMLSTPYRSARGTGLSCPNASLCVLPQTDSSGRLFPSGSSFGLGFNPAGLTARFRGDRTVSPSVGVVVGGLLFDRAVPTTRATRFNFTASAEFGVRIGPPDRQGITLMYRFHHLSNAGTSPENPGVASHLFTAGLRFRR